MHQEKPPSQVQSNPEQPSDGAAAPLIAITKDQLKDLTKEKGLWDIWILSRKLPISWFNQGATASVFLVLATYAFTGVRDTSSLAQEVRSISEVGFNFASSILGFLIAGFTIFTTLNKPGLFKLMARKKHEKSGLSYLKYNFFAFIDVFIRYIVFVGCCLLIKLFAGSLGPVSILISFASAQFPELDIITVKKYLVGLGLVLIGTWFFSLVIVLKSFIFNVYNAAMTSIRWELEEELKAK